MSTNKTQNYQLHAWLPQDEFHLTEINENFDLLDKALKSEVDAINTTLADEVAGIKTAVGKKARIVTGIYEGAGSTQHIDLVAKPLVVHIEYQTGYRGNSSSAIGGGMFSCDLPTTYATLDDTGFSVTSNGGTTSLNVNGKKYVYLAVLDDE